MITDWDARRKETYREIQKSYAEHLLRGTTDMADNHMEVSAFDYTCSKRFEQEKVALFQNTPLLAALSVDLPGKGDRVVFEDAGPSILIVRNQDNDVKAFLNMCMHRGAKLEHECKKSKLIKCPFHAWSYDLNGDIAAIPGEEGFENIDVKTKSLISVPCAEWNGFIFVTANPNAPAIDVEAFLGDFAPELLQLEVHRAEPVKSGVMTADTNWKYALDTYGESYHFAALHPETVFKLNMSNVGVFRGFGYHHRLNFPEHTAHDWVALPEAEWPEETFGAVHFLFPNTVIFFGSLSEGVSFLQIFRLFPGESVGKLKTQFAVYAPLGIESEEQRASVEMLGYDMTAHVVLTEDYKMASDSWARLKDAPDGFKLTFGANEPALQNTHKAFAEVMSLHKTEQPHE